MGSNLGLELLDLWTLVLEAGLYPPSDGDFLGRVLLERRFVLDLEAGVPPEDGGLDLLLRS